MNEPPVIPPAPARVRKLSAWRMALAIAIAASADGLQVLLPPFGWAIDIVAALLATWLLGFHWLLLPTFVLELFPLVDAIPTWTGCVIAVIALRKREQHHLQKSAAPPGPTIDV